MSESSQENWFFQDGEDCPYKGEELRDHTSRPELSKESQTLLNLVRDNIDQFRKEFKRWCRDNCIIPGEMQEQLPKMVDAIKQIGGGKISDGINRGLDTYKQLDGILKTKSAFLKSVGSALVKAFIQVLFMILIGGAIYYIKFYAGK